MAPAERRVSYLEGKVESLATNEELDELETQIVHALIGGGE